MPYEEVNQGTIVKLDEDNPSIEGIFIEITEGQYGPLFAIQQRDGSKVVLPSDTVLQTKLTKNLLMKDIKVEFNGMKDSTRRKGKQYKDYKVFVNK